MSKTEVIEQLISLKSHCNSMKNSDDIWKLDVIALDYAISSIIENKRVFEWIKTKLLNNYKK